MYALKGWVHLENVVPNDVVNTLREHALAIRSRAYELSNWKGVSCAGKHDDVLMSFYTSELMYNVATSLLGETVYLFNDQVVCKLAQENLAFEPHFDNEFGPNSDGAINTVNCCVILDNFTKQNGALSVQNQDDDEWITLYPKAGDIVAIDGNTYHKSDVNCSDEHRCLYACVYADNVIYYDQYYTNRFNL